MKFVIMSNCVLPECGVRGPVLTPRYYDIHLVLRWIAAGVDIREVMEDGSYRKLEFNDERVMKELDEELERKRIEKEQKIKLLEETKVEVKKPAPKKMNIYPPEPVKPIKKEKKEEKPVVKEEPKVVEKKKPAFEIDELEPME